MVANQATYLCARCGTEFAITTPHTELVRRDFVEVPRPSQVERLCRDCWTLYIEDFLGDEFTHQFETVAEQ